ncbi:NAD(P)H-binding protein [Bradyrhizobium jicamae]|uniref:SDR family oxidoreductase n=1 Tax=Bradyrhizobium jicamae TaxID=280332 RepID=UPI001BAB6957|nr:NAD(P)H-binding protein [Bradyrhizobium jicamae]MBR0757196.1 NAD(P)H-binding protein [Bradyrhizobium jicamae]
MSAVLVTGGTGHLGRDLVDRLVQAGHKVRVLARTPQPRADVEWAVGDLATGAGVHAAMDGVSIVINAATHSPIARRGGFRPIDFFRSPPAVDVDGTARLLAAAHDAGVQHFLHVSIVGLDDATLPYARVKLAGEQLVRQSPLRWSIVRAMPFYYLLENFLARLSWLPVWPVPKASFNPVDTTDVAGYLAACAFDGNAGDRAEIGGPEDLSFVMLAREYQAARGLRRAILPLPLSEKSARGMGFVVSQGVRGGRSWMDWLSRCRDDGEAS